MLQFRGNALAREGKGHAVREALLAGGVEGPPAVAGLDKVVKEGSVLADLLATDDLRLVRVCVGLTHGLVDGAGEVVDLTGGARASPEVHGTVDVVVLERALGGVDGEHLVVHTEAIPLGVRI